MSSHVWGPGLDSLAPSKRERKEGERRKRRVKREERGRRGEGKRGVERKAKTEELKRSMKKIVMKRLGVV